MWKKLNPGHILRYLYYELTEVLYPRMYPVLARARARVLGEKLILVVGDSHSQSYYLHYPFVVHHLGAATAYNLGNPRSSTHSWQKLEKVVSGMDKYHERLLLVFGEIDCRIHIYKKYKEIKGKRSILSLIKATVEKYGSVIKKLREAKVPFAVLSVAPAGLQGNIYHYKYYADFATRAKIARQFNEELKKYCGRHGYAFLDLYQHVVDKDGGVKKAYLKDQVHLNAKVAPITRALLLSAD